jgi:predicted nucleotidyltransferase
MEEKGNNISLIKAAVSKYVPDADIIWFGSRARNDALIDSDYDILIRIKDQITVKEKIMLRTKIRKELLKRDIRSDILIQSHEEIEKKRNLPGHIIRNLMKDAIVL